MFVVTNICHDKTQKIFCCDKHNFSQQNFCHDKHTLCVLSRQTHVCRDKHVFVVTKLVTTKMILVAAPANNNTGAPSFIALLTADVLSTLCPVPTCMPVNWFGQIINIIGNLLSCFSNSVPLAN